MSSDLYDRRPIVVALAGPNGAGKSTFYETRLRESGLRFINADELARELSIDAYAAADAADEIRRKLIAARESFVFETVLSDPHGEKVTFLRETSESGYTVVLIYIGLEDVERSDQRVAIRVAQGGHDVPRAKLEARFARSLRNLQRAISQLPYVLVFDNSTFGQPHRLLAEIHSSRPVHLADDLPRWFEDLPAEPIKTVALVL